jgi:hypothetical protein
MQVLVEHEHVAHLPARTGLCLPVEMKSRLGLRKDRSPIWNAVAPKVTEEVHHDRGAGEGRISKRQVEHRANVLLELRSDASTEGVVAAIVWPRSDFVHEQTLATHHEHLDR